MYQENILDHYKHPRNFGRIDNATIHHHEKNPLCGDEMDFYFIIKDGRIEDAKFGGHGCAISQASASMLSEELIGKSLKDVSKINKEKIIQMLGIPISPVRLKCALLSLDTAKNAILIYEKYVK